jgi:hypothetical protein
MSCHVVLPPSNMTTNNSAIAIETTSATDMIHLAAPTKTTALFSTETAKQEL